MKMQREVEEHAPLLMCQDVLRVFVGCPRKSSLAISSVVSTLPSNSRATARVTWPRVKKPTCSRWKARKKASMDEDGTNEETKIDGNRLHHFNTWFIHWLTTLWIVKLPLERSMKYSSPLISLWNHAWLQSQKSNHLIQVNSFSWKLPWQIQVIPLSNQLQHELVQW